MNTVVNTINAAGQAFVDFALPMLIQSGVLVLILLLIDLALRRRIRAVFRYWIWMLVLLKLVLPPSLCSPFSFGTWFGQTLETPTVALQETPAPAWQPQTKLGDGVLLKAPIAKDFALDAATPVVTPPVTPPAPQPKYDAVKPAVAPAPTQPTATLSWQALVLLAWVATVLALLLLLLQRAFFVHSLVAQAQEAPPKLTAALDECRAGMGLARPVALRVSPNAASPAVCGLLRPVILIPKSLAPKLQEHDLEAVLLHELAHVKRGDLWVNLIQTLLQIAYFYNPLLWLANVMIRRIREQAVDEAVLVAMGETARDYPKTLLNVAKLAFRKRPTLSLRLIGVVESKSALSGRIRHILGRPLPKTAKLGMLGLVVVFLIAAVFLPMAKARPMTNRARNVMALARQEVRQLNHSYIGTEHILLALAREKDAVSTQVLENLGADIDTLRAEVGKLLKSGSEPVTSRRLPRTPRAKRVMKYAREEARALSHNYIGTEHILLGLTEEAKSIAGQVLANLDLTPTQIRAEVLKLVRTGHEDDAGVRSDPTGENGVAEHHAGDSSHVIAELPNGVRVELVGVCEHPSAGKEWWRPDGEPLSLRPYNRLNLVTDNPTYKHYEVLFRADGGADDVSTVLEISDQIQQLSGPRPVKEWGQTNASQSAENLFVAIVSLEPAADQVGIRIGVGLERDWKTHGVLNSPVDRTQTYWPGVIFSPALEKDEQTFVTVAHRILDRQVRLIAMDKDGTVHKLSGSSTTIRGADLVSCQARVDLPADKIESIRFETQKFAWITFDSVTLRRGRRTAVQVRVEPQEERGGQGTTETDESALLPLTERAAKVMPVAKQEPLSPPIFGHDVKLNFADPTVRDGSFHSQQSVAFVMSFHDFAPASGQLFTGVLIGQTNHPFILEGDSIAIQDASVGRQIGSEAWPADQRQFDKVVTLPVTYGQKHYSCPVHVEMTRQEEGGLTGSYWFCAYLSGRLPWGAGGRSFEIVNLDQQMEFRLVGDGTNKADAVLGIDIDGNGRIDPAETGGERFRLYEPFRIGSGTYRVTEVDPYLPRVVFREVDSAPTPTSSRPTPDPGRGMPTQRIELPDVDHEAVMLDLASGKLVAAPRDESETNLREAILDLGQGDLVFDSHSLILVRDATSPAAEKMIGEPFSRCPIGQHFPEVLAITTAEGRRYEIMILAADNESCTLKCSLLSKAEDPGAGVVAALPNGVTVEFLAYSQLTPAGLKWWTPEGKPTTIPGVYEADVEGHGTLLAFRMEPEVESLYIWSYQPPNIRNKLEKKWHPEDSDIWLVALDEDSSFVNIEIQAIIADPPVLAPVTFDARDTTDRIEIDQCGIGTITNLEAVGESGLRLNVSTSIGDPQIVAVLDEAGQPHSVRKVSPGPYGGAGGRGQVRLEANLPTDQLAGILVETRATRGGRVKFRNISLDPSRSTETQVEVVAEQQGPWWGQSQRSELFQGLAQSLAGYAEFHNSRYPDTLAERGSEEWIERHVAYLGRGKTLADDPPTVIAYEKTLLPNGYGTYVVHSDNRVEFNTSDELEALGIPSDDSGPDMWQMIGPPIPPDANDTRTLAPGIRLDGIGSAPDGRVFVSTVRDTAETNGRQYRFVLTTKAGETLAPICYGSLEQADGKLWEKYTFDTPYLRWELESFRLQWQSAAGQVAVAPTAHGEILSAATDAQGSPLALQAPPGQFALAFDGRDDCLYVPDSESLRTAEQLKIEMWFKPQFPPGPYEHRPGWALLAKGAALGTGRVSIQGFGIALYKQDDRPDSVMFDRVLATEEFLASSGTLWKVPDDWMHFSETFQRDSFIPAPGQPLVFGRFLIPTEEPFQGQIAEIRIWDAARSGYTPQYENGALTGSEPGLVACWTFEEGAGPIARDISPHANHARLGNSIADDDADPTWVDLETSQNVPGQVSGQVLDPNGVPVSGAQVALCTKGQGVLVQDGRLHVNRMGVGDSVIVETDAQGRFTFADEPEAFHIVAAHEKGFAWITNEDLASSPEVRLESWGRIEGTLYIGRERGAEKRMALMNYINKNAIDQRIRYEYEAHNDPNGRFIFDKVPPGWAEVGYLIRVGGPSFPTSTFTSRTPLQILPGQTTRRSIGGRGRPVMGEFIPQASYDGPVYFGAGLRALDTVQPDRPTPDNYEQMTKREQQQWLNQGLQTDEARAYYDAIWHDPQRRHYSFRIQEDGTFRIEDVIPGKYKFTVWLEERFTGQDHPEEIGAYYGTVEVPEMAEAYSAEPLDLGELVVQMRTPLHVGDTAPLFEARTLDDNDIRLADYRGGFVLLSFWQPASHPELDRLKELHETYSSAGKLQIIGLGGSDTLDEVKKRVAEHKIDWPHIYFGEHWDQGIAQQYSLPGLPYILLVDPEGKIVATWLRGEKLTNTVRKALGETN